MPNDLSPFKPQRRSKVQITAARWDGARLPMPAVKRSARGVIGRGSESHARFGSSCGENICVTQKGRMVSADVPVAKSAPCVFLYATRNGSTLWLSEIGR